MMDPLSPIPLYHQLADELAADIESGKIPDRQRLPSESYLEQEHGLARGTVRSAIKLLRERGLAFTIQGRGTFAGPAAEEVGRVAHPAGTRGPCYKMAHSDSRAAVGPTGQRSLHTSGGETRVGRTLEDDLVYSGLR